MEWNKRWSEIRDEIDCEVKETKVEKRGMKEMKVGMKWELKELDEKEMRKGRELKLHPVNFGYMIHKH